MDDKQNKIFIVYDFFTLKDFFLSEFFFSFTSDIFVTRVLLVLTRMVLEFMEKLHSCSSEMVSRMVKSPCTGAYIQTQISS